MASETLVATPLLSLVTLVPGVAVAYLCFAVGVGPRLMRSRPPLRPKVLIAAYNALQVFFNVVMLTRTLAVFMHPNYKLTCPPLLPSIDIAATAGGFDELSKEVIRCAFYQAILRVFDLLDTVFIVLAKKNSSLSFLHLYHHASVLLTCWYLLKEDAGGSITLMPAAINNFVHTCMYAYYLLSLLGFNFAQACKKYITKLQIIQFVTVLLYVSFAALQKDCKISKRLVMVNLGQATAFLILFLNFYVRNYKPKKKV